MALESQVSLLPQINKEKKKNLVIALNKYEINICLLRVRIDGVLKVQLEGSN